MIELRRTKSKVTISPTIWTMSIELARLCGWVPTGTHSVTAAGVDPVEQKEFRQRLQWQMEYVAGDGQTVVREDAVGLGNALLRAIREGDVLLSQWIAGQIEPPATLRTPATGFRWFTTPAGKAHLQTLASFCQQGEFQIF
jgi:hypothetical protein